MTVPTDVLSLAPEALEPLPSGEFIGFPDSPFQLYMPYPPAGDQPEAIT
ncbi:MAG: hypothetical protein H0W38_19095, partial [Methylibium sp.]|nr:hypothetical protein [Methylibium sp.]